MLKATRWRSSRGRSRTKAIWPQSSHSYPLSTPSPNAHNCLVANPHITVWVWVKSKLLTTLRHSHFHWKWAWWGLVVKSHYLLTPSLFLMIAHLQKAPGIGWMRDSMGLPVSLLTFQAQCCSKREICCWGNYFKVWIFSFLIPDKFY